MKPAEPPLMAKILLKLLLTAFRELHKWELFNMKADSDTLGHLCFKQHFYRDDSSSVMSLTIIYKQQRVLRLLRFCLMRSADWRKNPVTWHGLVRQCFCCFKNRTDYSWYPKHDFQFCMPVKIQVNTGCFLAGMAEELVVFTDTALTLVHDSAFLCKLTWVCCLLSEVKYKELCKKRNVKRDVTQIQR